MFSCGWYFTFKLPNSVTSWGADQGFPPEFAEGSQLSGVRITCSHYGNDIGAVRWRTFFESCQASTITGTLTINRGRGFSSDYFKDLSGNVIFDGSHCKVLRFSGLSVSSDQFENLINLNGFGVLTGLKELEFDTLNHLTNFSGISTLTNLQRLVVKSCHLSSVSDFSGLTGLKTLAIRNNEELTDISDISVLTGLTYLEIYNTSISSCVPLKNMTNLTTLNLQKNAIGEKSGTEYNLDILYNLHSSKNGKLTRLYLKENKNLQGIIDNNKILTLNWLNNTISGEIQVW